MYVAFFFIQTIEAVTFRLRGRCMLGVLFFCVCVCVCGFFFCFVFFFLPALIRLGHDCQGLLSLCGGMHVCTA